MKYKVAEIFSSYQGEGFHAGRRATFIRLAGCNLQCEFCDTVHDEKFQLTAKEIAEQVVDDFVVITGGEPTIQNLWDLVYELRILKRKEVAIETNGTNPIQGAIQNLCWITVSPKKKCRLEEANEVKVVNWLVSNLRKYETIKADHYFVQPCEDDGKINYEKTAELARKTGGQKWRLSLQLHKVFKIA